MLRKWIKKHPISLLPLAFLCLAVLFFVYRASRNHDNALRGELVSTAYAENAKLGADESGGKESTAETKAGETKAVAPETVSGAEYVSVYLCGAVQKPDVYEVAKGTRLNEVLKLADGFREDAAKDAVNLAAIVEDGSMIRVPTLEEAAMHAEPSGAALAAEENSGKVDLNRAEKAELMTLPGVGERKAEQILAYRKAHGKFRNIEEIKNIPGIKEKAFEKLKDSIVVRE